MKFLKTSLVIVSSVGLIFLGACNSGNQAVNSESANKTATTQTNTKTEPVAKTGEAHNENDGHAHNEKGDQSNNGEHKGQVIESGKYHLEFKPNIEKDSTHLDVSVHGEQDKAITDAKLTASRLKFSYQMAVTKPYNFLIIPRKSNTQQSYLQLQRESTKLLFKRM